jgi:hypothetical protein
VSCVLPSHVLLFLPTVLSSLHAFFSPKIGFYPIWVYALSTTPVLIGITRPWDAFIQTICAIKEKLQFDSLWEEHVQEEARVSNQEAVLLRDGDQALAAHIKGGKRRYHFKKETHPHKESHFPNIFIHKNITLQGDSRSFRKVKEEKKISHLINVTIVTRWDIFLKIVHPEEKNTRRETTKDTMPMQWKMMSHPRR